jgi:hypothetical protein
MENLLIDLFLSRIYIFGNLFRAAPIGFCSITQRCAVPLIKFFSGALLNTIKSEKIDFTMHIESLGEGKDQYDSTT